MHRLSTSAVSVSTLTSAVTRVQSGVSAFSACLRSANGDFSPLWAFAIIALTSFLETAFFSALSSPYSGAQPLRIVMTQARADVANADQAVGRTRAEWTYSNNNLHRIEPLLLKQFVTVDQVDRARATEIEQAQALKQAESQLRQAQAALHSTVDANAEAAKKMPTTQRPPTVYAESITADNAHQKALALEAEMDFDLQSVAVPPSPAATR